MPPRHRAERRNETQTQAPEAAAGTCAVAGSHPHPPGEQGRRGPPGEQGRQGCTDAMPLPWWSRFRRPRSPSRDFSKLRGVLRKTPPKSSSARGLCAVPPLSRSGTVSNFGFQGREGLGRDKQEHSVPTETAGHLLGHLLNRCDLPRLAGQAPPPPGTGTCGAVPAARTGSAALTPGAPRAPRSLRTPTPPLTPGAGCQRKGRPPGPAQKLAKEQHSGMLWNADLCDSPACPGGELARAGGALRPVLEPPRAGNAWGLSALRGPSRAVSAAEKATPGRRDGRHLGGPGARAVPTGRAPGAQGPSLEPRGAARAPSPHQATALPAVGATSPHGQTLPPARLQVQEPGREAAATNLSANRNAEETDMAPTATARLGKAGRRGTAARLATSLASRGHGPRAATGSVPAAAAHRPGAADGGDRRGGADRALSPPESQGGAGGRLGGKAGGAGSWTQHRSAPRRRPAATRSHTPHRTGQRVPKPTDSSMWEARRSHIWNCLDASMRNTHCVHSVTETAGMGVSHRHRHLQPCPNTCLGTFSRGGRASGP